MADDLSLSLPAAVLAELYDADEFVRKQFANAVAAQTIEFSEAFAPVFTLFENFRKDCLGSVQREMVAALMHGVLDDCLTSVKLLLSGKLSASGNGARQAVEGICMSIMCAHDGLLMFGNEEHRYWELLQADDKRAEGNRSPWQLVANVARLGLTEQGAEQLKQTVETHHAHSHAGRLAIANRMDLGDGGKIYFGGHFDPAKLDGYQKELMQRIAVCRWAGETIAVLWPLVKALPIVNVETVLSR